jgi:hypothetical protein
MDELLRSFVCLPLQHDLQKRIAAWIRELKNTAPSLKWVRPRRSRDAQFSRLPPYPISVTTRTLRRTLREKKSLQSPWTRKWEMLPLYGDLAFFAFDRGNCGSSGNPQRLVRTCGNERYPRKNDAFFRICLCESQRTRD